MAKEARLSARTNERQKLQEAFIWSHLLLQNCQTVTIVTSNYVQDVEKNQCVIVFCAKKCSHKMSHLGMWPLSLLFTPWRLCIGCACRTEWSVQSMQSRHRALCANPFFRGMPEKLGFEWALCCTAGTCSYSWAMFLLCLIDICTARRCNLSLLHNVTGTRELVLGSCGSLLLLSFRLLLMMAQTLYFCSSSSPIVQNLLSRA